jgi:hypothetical protein
MSASAMPGRDDAEIGRAGLADALERRHDAPHRAEQADVRRDARRRRQERHAVLEFVHLDRRGPEQRAIEGLQTP